MSRIKAIIGDITAKKYDAIVNGANRDLVSGGGVFKAIHSVAGPQLLEECQGLGGAKLGEAKITKGYKLPSPFVIHTVGPVYGQEDGLEDEYLESCYHQALSLADERKLKTIAFPNLSTGLYRYPKDEAAEIALSAIAEYFKDNPGSSLETVYLVSFNAKDYAFVRQAVRDLGLPVELESE